ncbi:AraC family ligand binding domain-containing protein, partial [Paraburkholderia sp. SIMBA_054]
VILIEPGERHDGQAVAADGFAYNMLYMPQSLVRSAMGGNDAYIGFRETLADDGQLFHAVARACEAIFLEAPRLMIEDC